VCGEFAGEPLVALGAGPVEADDVDGLALRWYLVVMASREATVEASQTWEALRSMTTRSRSSAYSNWV